VCNLIKPTCCQKVYQRSPVCESVMIRLACPKCKKKLGVQEALAGRVAVCPQCRSKFRVPQQERTTEAATEEAVTALPKREPAPPPRKPRPPAPESDDEREEPVRPKRRRIEDDDVPE